MTNKLEDLAGKALIVLVFLALALAQLRSIVAMIRLPEGTDYWELVLCSRALGLVFLCMIVGVSITRLPPKQTATGIEPRLSSLAGTFILMFLPVLPIGALPPEMLLVSTIIIAVGTGLSIYCLFWLGRSFSIMATARSLVMSGPYAIVRHPLYATEAISIVGLLIANWSITAVVLCAAQFAFQFRRMFNEERILRHAFPEYAEYARRVPMVIPRFGAIAGLRESRWRRSASS